MAKAKARSLLRDPGDHPDYKAPSKLELAFWAILGALFLFWAFSGAIWGFPE